jgi:hypothetical protein
MRLAPTFVAMKSQGPTMAGMTTFMAECFWPGVTAQKVADAGERVRQATLAPGPDGGFVHYVGSILVPTDEIALVLLEAAWIDAATDVAQQAAIPSERIVEIVRLGAFVPNGRGQPHTARQRSFDESHP